MSFVVLLSVIFLLPSPIRASVPYDLSNFHGEYTCDLSVRLVRPKTFEDVKGAVVRHRRVTPVGTGMSWNRAFFCSPPASDGDSSAVIVMSTIARQTIEVVESEMVVWVSAGIQTWDLVEYLRRFKTPSAPEGYSLGMTSLFLNQTVVGAVATGTHGSSLKYSSLSNQVVGFKAILANGSEMEIDPKRHPLYFRAFQVNVGRLGVVTHVKMRIVKNGMMVKLTRDVCIPFKRFISRLEAAQEEFKSTGALPSWMETVMFWIKHSSFQVSHLLKPPLICAQVIEQRIDDIGQPMDRNQTTNSSSSRDIEPPSKKDILTPHSTLKRRQSRRHRIADGVRWDRPTPLPPLTSFIEPEFVISNDPSVITGLAVASGIMPRHEAVFALEQNTADALGLLLYDAYEYAIPVNKMADCLKGAVAFLKKMKLDNGLRSAIVLRFTGKENGLLSQANKMPVMWLDVTEFVYYNQLERKANEPFREFIAYLVTSPKCSPTKMHWGKAGWPDQGCWNGADAYGLNWCHFGCVVRELDPDDKFIGSAPGTWNWKGAHLDKCCTADGYDSTIEGCDCAVAPLRKAGECPQAPFFSNR